MVGNGVKYISNRDYLRTNPFKFDSNRPIGFRDDNSKTGHYDIAEILLTVALNTINKIYSIVFIFHTFLNMKREK
jgi:hypothetical protein